MNLRRVLLRYFLPFVVLFMVLSILSMSSSVQKIYYPAFSSFTVATLNKSFQDTYFKDKPKNEKTDFNYNNIGVLFQSKNALRAVAAEAKRTRTRAKYEYKGFNVAIDETYIAPILFFLCLLLFSPGSKKNKFVAFVLGTLLILGFAFLIVYFKGLFMVSKSGVRDLQYSSNDIGFFQYLHFFFSPVTIVSVVLITWILVAFRKSDLKKILDTYKLGE